MLVAFRKPPPYVFLDCQYTTSRDKMQAFFKKNYEQIENILLLSRERAPRPFPALRFQPSRQPPWNNSGKHKLTAKAIGRGGREVSAESAFAAV